MSAGDELIGQTLGAYRCEARLGSGATGVVYRASPAGGGAPVALKVLHDNLGSISGLERRFEREARVLEKFKHDNIVRILDFGIAEGRTFIAMEILEGETLEDSLEREALHPPDAISLYRPILAALAAAHEHEVVHRDLKPANVFMLSDGSVKLLDFGLAKMLSVEDVASEDTLTRRGRIVGTPAYMAPEQITGVFIDVRADVYALGVMLFELLADRRPFLYERRSELLRAHLLEPIPKVTDVRPGLWIAPALEKLLLRSLEKDPHRRFENGGAMREAWLALPEDCVRFEAPSPRQEKRARTGPSSAVISDRERREITESAGLSTGSTSDSASSRSVHTPSGSLPTGLAERLERKTDTTDKVRVQPRETPEPETKRGLSTPALAALTVLILALAAGLWWALMTG